ncbi:hypothetical protein [Rhodococcus sp. NPDC127528]|uniref:hypothetical protein n=1 Tax=unclassified Rhodococcus (in: high G+C Gram-positive bacteria) TaxID=192944 RepID=UPI00363EF31B
MSEGMRVDVVAVGALGSALAAAADAVAAVDPAPGCAAAAMPGSQTRVPLAELPDALARAYRATAESIRSMSGAAVESAARYAGTDAATAVALLASDGGR